MSEAKKDLPQGLSGEIQTLIAGFFPTTQFFETRFQMLQIQIDELRRNQEGFKEQLRDVQAYMDKRFEQVDKRFEQMEQRMHSLEDKIDRLIERIDVKVDTGLQESRALSIRLFTFAMTFAAISVFGLVGRIFGLY